MLTIGEFSRLCFVTKKTLRHYDEIGLLRPEHVAENGYRYYAVAQLRTMRLITRLKGYGFSLPEVALAIAEQAPDALARRLEAKRAQLQADVQQAQRSLAWLDQDLIKLHRREDIMDTQLSISTTQRPESTIYGIRRRIGVKNFGELFGELFANLGRAGVTPQGPPMAFYHEEDFNPDDSDIEVAVPVAKNAPGARALPGGLCCFTALVGPYEHQAFMGAYTGLMEWINQNGYRVAAAPYEVYVRGGEDTAPENYLTEIYFPIEKA